jgi:hypothetical protein
MIRVATWPDPLSDWDGEKPPFYLEIFGEAEPVVDAHFAEVLPPGKSDAETTVSTPIYEYWWTIGHPGLRPEHHHLLPHKSDSKWAQLQDTAAHVYLYFPINAGWRVKELVATVKYLSPTKDEKTLSERAAEDWQRAEPALSAAGSISQALSPIPGVGTVAAGAAPVLSALSKLQIGTVPQGAQGFDWYVAKVSTAGQESRGVLQGIMWTLPKQMFEALGGRLTGSLAVSFVPCQDKSSEAIELKAGQLRGHAAVFFKDSPSWVPAVNRFVELEITPKDPDAASKTKRS